MASNTSAMKVLEKSHLFLNQRLNKDRSYHKTNRSISIFKNEAKVGMPLQSINWGNSQDAVKQYGRFSEWSKLYYESKSKT